MLTVADFATWWHQLHRFFFPWCEPGVGWWFRRPQDATKTMTMGRELSVGGSKSGLLLRPGNFGGQNPQGKENKPAGNELLSLGTHFLALVLARIKCRWIFLAILL